MTEELCEFPWELWDIAQMVKCKRNPKFFSKLWFNLETAKSKVMKFGHLIKIETTVNQSGNVVF